MRNFLLPDARNVRLKSYSFYYHTDFYVLSFPLITFMAFMAMVKNDSKKYDHIFMYFVGFTSRCYSTNLPTSNLI